MILLTNQQMKTKSQNADNDKRKVTNTLYDTTWYTVLYGLLSVIIL